MNLVDKNYFGWIADLKKRYKATQIKAAVAVNSAMIEFYWNLGKDISERYNELTRSEIYGSKFFNKLSADLKSEIPSATGLSPQNIRYCLHFYELYLEQDNFPQLVGKSSVADLPLVVGAKDVNSRIYRPQPVDDKQRSQLVLDLTRVPWGHHRTIIDKCKGDREKS